MGSNPIFPESLFRLTVRTSPFHGANTGSNPVRDVFMKNFKYFLDNSNLLYKNIQEIKLRCYYSILSIVLTFITCYLYINQIIYVLTTYLLNNMHSHRFIFTKVTEVFYTYIQISIITSLLICFPFILFNIWLFIVPGLYKYERLYYNFFNIIILLFFIISFFISYFYIIPNILNFFLYFENNSIYFPLHFEAKINDYLFPIYFFLFNMIVCFQFPSVLIFLLYKEVLTYSLLISKRKYFYLSFLFLSALIAPPDIYSQLILTILMLLFYEILIFFLFFFRNWLFIS